MITDKKYKKYIITAKALMPRVKHKEAETDGNQNAAPGNMPSGLAAPPGGAPGRTGITRRSRKKTNRNF